MLRCLLLLLCWCVNVRSIAMDRAELYLPRSGHTVDVWSGDLTKRLGRMRPDVQQDNQLYTLRGDHLPTLHFLVDEQRFSIPGVTVTGKPETFNEQGALRFVYRGSHQAGAIEKQARIELIKFDEGRCQLSWKLSVINRGERLRNQEGSMDYDCRETRKTKEHRRAAMHLLPNRNFSER